MPTGILPTVGLRDTTGREVTEVASDPAKQAVLDALEDPRCRAILDATGRAALSAKEVAAACDLPLSTTYRKLDLLVEADLVAARTRVRESGKHASEYVRAVEDVVVSLEPNDGIELRVSRREDPGAHLSSGDGAAETA